MGKWVPIHSDEYDGELPVETGREHDLKNGDGGVVVFNGDSLPWASGKYELRYHHDGKHNVMSNVGQVEIFGELHRCNFEAPQLMFSKQADRWIVRYYPIHGPQYRLSLTRFRSYFGT